MRKIIDAAAMRLIDATCGVPGIELMEKAAAAALRAAGELLAGGVANRRIVIAAGRGNNGGDGFALARLALAAGAIVAIRALCDEADLTGEALDNSQRARAAGVPFLSDHAAFEAEAAKTDLLVDAIFGTGFRPEAVPDEIRRVIGVINRRGREGVPVLAIDVPSGIAADAGTITEGIPEDEAAVRATATVTFGRPKQGLYLYPAATAAGRIILDPIGIPDSCFAGLKGDLPDHSAIARLLPRREPTAHKGHAKLLIVGGAEGMAGAALLAANAALKSGAGYVFVSLPRNAADPGQPIEAVRKPLPSTPEGYFAREAEAEALTLAESMNAVLFGGGMGLGETERGMTARWLRLFPCPAVVDASALRLASQGDLRSAQAPRILTPHPGEFATLFGSDIAENERDRIGVTLKAAERSGHVVVHKGRPTVTATPDGRFAVNPTGNEHLATCGSGDVLAGLIAALLSQGLDCFDAAVAGAYLHGLTASFWDYPVGLTAGRIADLIPKAWKTVLST